jgi:hypothetical protein
MSRSSLYEFDLVEHLRGLKSDRFGKRQKFDDVYTPATILHSRDPSLRDAKPFGQFYLPDASALTLGSQNLHQSLMPLVVNGLHRF